MIKQSDIEDFERDNSREEALCSGQRWIENRKVYITCEHRDECKRYQKFKETDISANYNSLTFVRHWYSKTFRKCEIYKSKK